jgi:hypothetical protein
MTATHPTTSHATSTATHYRLSIEARTYASPDGERLEVADLIATSEATGERWVYVGRVACSTQGEALDLMARIFAWERAGDESRELDPTCKAACWVAEGQPMEGRPVAHEVAEAVESFEVANTPSAWPKGDRNTHEVVEAVAVAVKVVIVKPGTVKVGGRRARKIDAGKVRRAKAGVVVSKIGY